MENISRAFPAKFKDPTQTELLDHRLCTRREIEFGDGTGKVEIGRILGGVAPGQIPNIRNHGGERGHRMDVNVVRHEERSHLFQSLGFDLPDALAAELHALPDLGQLFPLTPVFRVTKAQHFTITTAQRGQRIVQPLLDGVAHHHVRAAAGRTIRIDGSDMVLHHLPFVHVERHELAGEIHMILHRAHEIDAAREHPWIPLPCHFVRKIDLASVETRIPRPEKELVDGRGIAEDGVHQPLGVPEMGRNLRRTGHVDAIDHGTRHHFEPVEVEAEMERFLHLDRDLRTQIQRFRVEGLHVDRESYGVRRLRASDRIACPPERTDVVRNRTDIEAEHLPDLLVGERILDKLANETAANGDGERRIHESPVWLPPSEMLGTENPNKNSKKEQLSDYIAPNRISAVATVAAVSARITRSPI